MRPIHKYFLSLLLLCSFWMFFFIGKDSRESWSEYFSDWPFHLSFSLILGGLVAYLFTRAIKDDFKSFGYKEVDPESFREQINKNFFLDLDLNEIKEKIEASRMDKKYKAEIKDDKVLLFEKKILTSKDPIFQIYRTDLSDERNIKEYNIERLGLGDSALELADYPSSAGAVNEIIRFLIYGVIN